MRMILTAAAVMIVAMGCTNQTATPAAPDPAAPAVAVTAPLATKTVAVPGVVAETAATAAAVAVPPVLVLNQKRPGEPFALAGHLVPGKITIVDFYSEYCPPCMRIAPALEKLAASRSDLVVRKLDINRPGVRGIDWSSPLAQQYGLNSIPHFKIYDTQGQLLAEGEAATAKLFGWLQESGINP